MLQMPETKYKQYTKKEVSKLTVSELSNMPVQQIEFICQDKELREALLKNVTKKVNKNLGQLRKYFEDNQYNFTHRHDINDTIKEHLKYKHLKRGDKVIFKSLYNPKPRNNSYSYANAILDGIHFLEKKTSTPQGIKQMEYKRKRAIEVKIAKAAGITLKKNKNGEYIIPSKVRLSDAEYERVLKSFEKMRKSGAISGEVTYKYDFGDDEKSITINNISLTKKYSSNMIKGDGTIGKGKGYVSPGTGSVYGYAKDAWLDNFTYLAGLKEAANEKLKEELEKADTTNFSLLGITPIKSIPGIPPID